MDSIKFVSSDNFDLISIYNHRKIYFSLEDESRGSNPGERNFFWIFFWIFFFDFFWDTM